MTNRGRSRALGLAIAFSLCTQSPAAASTTIEFDDVTSAWNLEAPLTGMYAHASAWSDIDADGWQDLFVGTFADEPIARYVFRGATGPSPDRLLRGGPGGFSIDASFPEMRGRTSGSTFADLDADGDPDLVVARHFRATAIGQTPSVILENRDGSFQPPVTLTTGIGARAVLVLDFDADGLLDLFVVGDRFVRVSSRLFRNLGGLRFEDVTASVGLPTTNVFGLSGSASDLNGDGRTDLVVSGSTPSGQFVSMPTSRSARIFINEGGTFRETDNAVFTWPTYRVDDDVAGVAVADLNRDARPDIVLAHHYASTTKLGTIVPIRLYVHEGLDPSGAPIYRDVTNESGMPGFRTKAPHVEVVDLDNDGAPDLLVAASADGGTRPTVLRNTGTVDGIPRFQQVGAPGTTQYWPVGGSIDVDQDGRQDALMIEWEPSIPSRMFRNITADVGHWLTVEVLPPAEAPGAVVEVYRSGELGAAGALLGVREVTTTTGYAGGIPAFVTFGLGAATAVDVRIRLPNGGRVIDLTGMRVDRVLRIPTEPTAGLGVTVSADRGTVPVGGRFTFSVRVRSDGPWPATGVVLSDAIPDALEIVSVATSHGSCDRTGQSVSCAIGTLPPEDVALVTIEVRARRDGVVADRACATALESDPDPADDCGSATVVVLPHANLTIDKTITSGRALVGRALTYALDVENHGPSSAEDVVVTDPLPPRVRFVSASTSRGSCSLQDGVVRCALGTLKSDRSARVTLTVEPTEAGDLVNTATVRSATTDDEPDDDRSTARTMVEVPADLSVAVEAPPRVFLGAPYGVEVVVRNAGPYTARGVELTDVLPPGSRLDGARPDRGNCAIDGARVRCSLGDLGADEAISVAIDAFAVAEGEGVNVADVWGQTVDESLHDNRVESPVAVLPAADIGVTVDAPAETAAGAPIEIAVRTANRGPSGAGPTRVDITLTAGLAIESVEPSSGTCEVPAGTIVCHIGMLPVGGEVSVALVGVLERPGAFSIEARAASPTHDPNPGDNAVTAEVLGADVTPPTVALVRPVAGRMYVEPGGWEVATSGGHAVAVSPTQPFEIRADAWDDFGLSEVRFWVDGVLLCVDGASPFACPWTHVGPPGTARVQVRSFDRWGHASEPAWVDVLVGL